MIRPHAFVAMPFGVKPGAVWYELGVRHALRARGS